MPCFDQGEATLTDDTGLFQLEYNQSCAGFLLCIQHPAYAPLTRVFNDEFSGATYLLQKAQLIETNYLGQPLDLMDSSNSTIHIPAGSLATTMERPFKIRLRFS